MHNFRWIIDNPNDTIQKYLMAGQFFEREELEFIASHINPGDVVIDAGANVGNHSVYFDKFTQAKTIYAIEPIPRTYKMLLANIALNYCHKVNVDYIGVGLGDRECIGYPYILYGKDNLGSTFLNPLEIPKDQVDQELTMDPVQVVPGDSLFENIHIDFIKMDVEGMEIVALNGLNRTIDQCRPKIFIEVMRRNDEEFHAWVADNHYNILDKQDKYSSDIFANYYIEPK